MWKLTAPVSIAHVVVFKFLWDKAASHDYDSLWRLFWGALTTTYGLLGTAILIMGLFQISSNLKRHNHLYHCNKCDVYFREYQGHVYKGDYRRACYSNNHNYVNNPYKWMNNHPDYPKHDVIQYLKFRRLERLIGKQKRERESLELFKKEWLKASHEAESKPDLSHMDLYELNEEVTRAIKKAREQHEKYMSKL